MFGTNVLVCTSTSKPYKDACASWDNCGVNGGRILSKPSSNKTLASEVSILPKSSFTVFVANSAIAPANSTPVGPPPTITKVNKARRSAASVSFSGASNFQPLQMP